MLCYAPMRGQGAEARRAQAYLSCAFLATAALYRTSTWLLSSSLLLRRPPVCLLLLGALFVLQVCPCAKHRKR